VTVETRQSKRAESRALEKAKARAKERVSGRPRQVDGRSIGYADPNYQSRYRITYKPRDASELPRDLYKPQEKQDILHACSAPNIWYGGAAGGGKSHGLRWHGYINCMRRKGLKVLLLRRQFTELEQTHILEIPTEIPADVASYHGTLHRLTFKSTGSFIQFGHAHTDKAVRSYLSTAWDLILIDEGSEFTPRMLSLLQSRARTKLAGIRPQMVIASNPGGEAHLWLVSRFITKKVDVKEDGNYKPDDYVFIQSLVGDNQYNDAFYVDRLRSMSEADREAFLFGNMDAFAGQYFREWSKTEHVIQKTAFGYGAPGDEGSLLEDWFEVEAGMDWGYSPSPGIVLWAAFDPFGRPTCYKELVFSESSPASVAQQIAERCTTEAEKRMTIRGDSQMWTKQVGTGVSIAEEINDCFAQMGLAITLVQSNKDRINGWARVHQYLDPRRPDPAGSGIASSYLKVYDVDEERALGCPYLISTIGAQVHSDKQDGDMKKQSNDHAADTLRYLLMGREPLSVLPRELVPGKTHRQKMSERTRKLIAGARKRLQEKRQELDESGLEVEDTPIDGLDMEGSDDDSEMIVLEGADDLWN
jgi:phage terminase large subunit